MTAHWGVPDPAAATGSEAEIRFAFANPLRMLTNRINIFVSLPLAKLDHLSLRSNSKQSARPRTLPRRRPPPNKKGARSATRRVLKEPRLIIKEIERLSFKPVPLGCLP